MEQQPNLRVGCLISDVSRSQKIHTHTHMVRLLRTNIEFVAEASSCIIRNKTKRRTSRPSAEFDTRNPSKGAAADLRFRPQATGIGKIQSSKLQIKESKGKVHPRTGHKGLKGE